MGKKKKQEKAKKHKDKEERLLKPEKQSKAEKQPKAEKQSKAERQSKPEKRLKAEQQSEPELQLKLEEQSKTVIAEPMDASETRTRQKRTEMSAEDEISPDVFRALGDESRIQILDLLKEQEMCAGELLKSVSIVQSTLSHHMKILVETGIVKCRKQGKWSYYSIDKAMLERVSVYIMKWS